MSIKFGEIDASQIIDNEFRIRAAEEILQWILNNNSSLTKPTQADIETIRQSVIAGLQKKYPNSGVTYKGV